MTLIKSILLGSAAGLVAVASAQAADLPTRKAAPVEYVRVCNVGGVTGWTLPGSDTCLKISGYITGQFIGGNLNTEYNYGTVGARRRDRRPWPTPPASVRMVGNPSAGRAGRDRPAQHPARSAAASPAQQNTT